ncbi:hypothetical protein K440DRAFT_172281 [Wilcoxina mikolae CBS 423.85]|nr:hypothetical protein K440DRAFT_172281 [Wilcoxina mikolae CBS 423.85]
MCSSFFFFVYSPSHWKGGWGRYISSLLLFSLFNTTLRHLFFFSPISIFCRCSFLAASSESKVSILGVSEWVRRGRGRSTEARKRGKHEEEEKKKSRLLLFWLK